MLRPSSGGSNWMTEAEKGSAPQVGPPPRIGAKEWLRRVVMMIGGPLLFLCAVEYVLWVFDVAPPADDVAAETSERFGGVPEPRALEEAFKTGKPTRLVCLGGSTVAGAPFEARMSMCTAMSEALGSEVVLVNLAGSGQDSNDVLAHAEIACKYPNSLMFVYSGHNEFLNLQRYVGETPPEPVRAASRFFSNFRFYRLLQRLMASETPRAARELGEPTITDNEVYANYEANLARLLTVCKGQPLVLSTVISNPDLAFVLPGTTRRESFRQNGRARPVPLDVDCKHCFRAGPRINQTVRRLAEQFAVPLVDTTDLLPGARGFELFWDHCHPRPEVHLEIARRVLKVAEAHGFVRVDGEPRHSLSADELRAAELERALYNVQFDPHWALERLDSISSPDEPVGYGVGMAIAGFIIDDLPRVRRGFTLAKEALNSSESRLEGLERCLREGRNSRGLSCMRWPSHFLMNETERQELAQLAQEYGTAQLAELIRNF